MLCVLIKSTKAKVSNIMKSQNFFAFFIKKNEYDNF